MSTAFARDSTSSFVSHVIEWYGRCKAIEPNPTWHIWNWIWHRCVARASWRGLALSWVTVRAGTQDSHCFYPRLYTCAVRAPRKVLPLWFLRGCFATHGSVPMIYVNQCWHVKGMIESIESSRVDGYKRVNSFRFLYLVSGFVAEAFLNFITTNQTWLQNSCIQKLHGARYTHDQRIIQVLNVRCVLGRWRWDMSFGTWWGCQGNPALVCTHSGLWIATLAMLSACCNPSAACSQCIRSPSDLRCTNISDGKRVSCVFMYACVWASHSGGVSGGKVEGYEFVFLHTKSLFVNYGLSINGYKTRPWDWIFYH